MNSSVLAHQIILQILNSLDLTPEEMEIDADEVIDLPWEDNSFATLEADPPWCYEDNGFNGFQSVQEYRVHCPYRTMAFRNIVRAGIEAKRVCKPDCHGYMWVTKDFLLEGLIAFKIWGFEFKNMIIWLKTSKSNNLSYGLGHWFRNGWEGMLFGTRGKPGRPAEATTQPNWFAAPKPAKLLIPDGRGGWTKHSRKPQEAYDLICRNSPGPRLSMFQRGTRAGFYCWGDEAIEGKTEDWNGDVSPAAISYDDKVCIGIDWDLEQASVVFDREDLEVVRTAFQIARDAVDDALPDRFSVLEERFRLIEEIIEQQSLTQIQEDLENELGDGGDGEEETAQNTSPAEPDFEDMKSRMSEAAWQECVDKGWVDHDE